MAASITDTAHPVIELPNKAIHRVLIVGTPGVGKTSLLNRMAKSGAYATSTGQDDCTVNVQGEVVKIHKTMEIFLADTPGYVDAHSMDWWGRVSFVNPVSMVVFMLNGTAVRKSNALEVHYMMQFCKMTKIPYIILAIHGGNMQLPDESFYFLSNPDLPLPAEALQKIKGNAKEVVDIDRVKELIFDKLKHNSANVSHFLSPVKLIETYTELKREYDELEKKHSELQTSHEQLEKKHTELSARYDEVKRQSESFAKQLEDLSSTLALRTQEMKEAQAQAAKEAQLLEESKQRAEADIKARIQDLTNLGNELIEAITKRNEDSQETINSAAIPKSAYLVSWLPLVGSYFVAQQRTLAKNAYEKASKLKDQLNQISIRN